MVSGSMLTPSSPSPYWQLIYCLSGVIEITESNLIVIFTFTFYADFPLPPDEFKLTSECTSTFTSNTSHFYFHFPKDNFCLRMSAFSPYPFTFISMLTFPFHLHFHFFFTFTFFTFTFTRQLSPQDELQHAGVTFINNRKFPREATDMSQVINIRKI